MVALGLSLTWPNALHFYSILLTTNRLIDLSEYLSLNNPQTCVRVLSLYPTIIFVVSHLKAPFFQTYTWISPLVFGPCCTHEFTIKKFAAKNKNRRVRAFLQQINHWILNVFVPAYKSSPYILTLVMMVVM